MMHRESNYKTAKSFNRIYPMVHPTTLKIIPPGPEPMEMVWEPIKNAPLGDPKVWGPAFWFTIHNGAAKYPINASPITQKRMKGFILGMEVMIPCEKCTDHATAHIEANWDRMDEIVSGRDKLFEFFVSFHNYVNRRHGKPIMSVEEAYKLYSGKANVSKLSYK